MKTVPRLWTICELRTGFQNPNETSTSSRFYIPNICEYFRYRIKFYCLFIYLFGCVYFLSLFFCCCFVFWPFNLCSLVCYSIPIRGLFLFKTLNRLFFFFVGWSVLFIFFLSSSLSVWELFTYHNFSQHLHPSVFMWIVTFSYTHTGEQLQYKCDRQTVATGSLHNGSTDNKQIVTTTTTTTNHHHIANPCSFWHDIFQAYCVDFKLFWNEPK